MDATYCLKSICTSNTSLCPLARYHPAMVNYCFLKVEYKFELKYNNANKKEKTITKFKISPKETHTFHEETIIQIWTVFYFLKEATIFLKSYHVF